MRFTPQFLDELRARLPVSEVVGRRVKLRKAGREWKGLSPFNQEKTPSFFVNDQKAMWFDFSSGKNGNIFDFLMLTDGVSFPEAVERLANEAGVPLPVMTREAAQYEEHRKTLNDVVEIAAKFFESTLAAKNGARGRGYLLDRGIAPATQLKFRLGYAPADQYALKEHLGAAKISVEDMAEAGLVVTGDDIPVPYDRFRDRVVFPISDWRGRVIAFGGRALEKEVSAKYLNSPETPLFHKGGTLYNIAGARKAAHDGARVIAVEGYVDVIAMVTAGFEGTVAPLGTALTADQLALLWRMADEPILCFDGDEAGRRAAYRALDLALPLLKPGKSLKLATLPDGQDPDDLARSGGREAIDDVLNAARPLAHMLWQRESEAGAFDTPERRAALEARINEVTAGIGDETVRRYYRQDFSERLRGMFAPQRFSSGDGGRRPYGQQNFARQNGGRPSFGSSSFGGSSFGGGGMRRAQQATLPAPLQRDEKYVAVSPHFADSALHRGHRASIPRREALILQAALNYPWLLHDHLEELAEAEFRHTDTQKLKGALIDVFAHHFADDFDREHEGEERQALAAELARRGFAELLTRIERTITTHSVWAARPDAAQADVLMTWKQLVALHRQWHSLTRELREAEAALGQDNTEANYARLRDVKARLSSLDGTEALIEGFGASSGRTSRPV
ncbi:MAG TPA: DNA primase [Xanthobacteraceae bacterium]|jgi:DNA primase|nr:DNA primase [Xanthobacteraceae bacterium]